MKKLTRRAYNRKIMMFGAAIFMSVAMISTGFASWVVSSVKNAEANNVPVKVAIVSDKSLNVTLDDYVDNNWTGDVWTFDAATEDDNTRQSVTGKGAEARDDVRYDAADGLGGEKLTLPIKGKVDHAEYVSTLTVTVTLPESLATAINSGYLALPTNLSLTSDNKIVQDVSTQVTGKTGEQAFDASITLAWGNKFGGVNPCYYYDTLAVAESIENIVAGIEAFTKTTLGVSEGVSYTGTVGILVEATVS